MALGAKESANAEFLANNPEIAKQRQEQKAKEEQEELEKEKERERQDRIGKPNLMAICEIKVKPALKNPRSMDVDYSGSEYGTYNDGYAVNMKYYATNSFGAELMGMARCEFDKNGNLTKVEAP